MITATTRGAKGEQILILGLTRENVTRLIAGQPIHVSAETHPGFPEETTVVILFGETERTITEQLKPLIGDQTKVVAVPRQHPTKGS